MTDTPRKADGSSVLRPFEASEPAPLPPVEPSKVVPDPPATKAEPPAPAPPPPRNDTLAAAVPEVPATPAALADDPWAPSTSPVDPDVSTVEEPGNMSDDMALDPPLDRNPFDDGPADPPASGEIDGVDARSRDAAEAGNDGNDGNDADGGDDDAFWGIAPVGAHDDLHSDDLHDDDLHHDDDDAEAETGAELVPAAQADETITLPRTPFLIGLGVVALALIALLVLWQTAGGDDGETVVEAPDDVDDPATVDETPDPIDTDAVDAEAQIDELSESLTVSEAEVAGLEAQVSQLEERVEPGLPGSMLRRIVIGADAKFIDTLPGSIAVVGAYGGLTMINPETNQITSNGNVANAATRVLRTKSSVWLTNYADSEILQVNPTTNTVVKRIPFPGPDGIAKDGETLVVASYDEGYVARLDPTSGEVLKTLDVGGSPTDVISHPDHGLWVSVFDTGELIRINPKKFTVGTRVLVGQGPVGIAAGSTNLWVANHDEGTIAKVDPVNGEVLLTVVVGEGPTQPVVVGGSVWVTLTDEGSLVQVDVKDGSILTRTPLGGASAGGGPTGIAHGSGSLWVAMQGEQSVVRVELPKN